MKSAQVLVALTAAGIQHIITSFLVLTLDAPYLGAPPPEMDVVAIDIPTQSATSGATDTTKMEPLTPPPPHIITKDGYYDREQSKEVAQPRHCGIPQGVHTFRECGFQEDKGDTK